MDVDEDVEGVPYVHLHALAGVSSQSTWLPCTAQQSNNVTSPKALPDLGATLASMQRLERLELDYVTAGQVLHLQHLTNLTSLSLGQLDDCARVLAKHAHFPALQSLRLVNVRDTDDQRGTSKGCHVFRYPHLQKLELFDSVTDITSCIGALTALTELRVANLLAHSRLGLASELGSLSSLRVLYIHAEYGCAVPRALCSLSQLQRLGLAGNCDLTQLDGAVRQLRSLQTLYLANMAFVAWHDMIGQVVPNGLLTHDWTCLQGWMHKNVVCNTHRHTMSLPTYQH